MLADTTTNVPPSASTARGEGGSALTGMALKPPLILEVPSFSQSELAPLELKLMDRVRRAVSTFGLLHETFP